MKNKSVRLALVSVVAVLSVFGLSVSPADAASLPSHSHRRSAGAADPLAEQHGSEGPGEGHPAPIGMPRWYGHPRQLPEIAIQ